MYLLEEHHLYQINCKSLILDKQDETEPTRRRTLSARISSKVRQFYRHYTLLLIIVIDFHRLYRLQKINFQYSTVTANH